MTPSGQKIKDKITHMSLTVQVAVTDYGGLGWGGSFKQQNFIFL